MEFMEFSAKTVSDAITDACQKLEVTSDRLEVVVVEEAEIAQGMLFLMENQKVVAEGSGAVSTAALLSRKYVPQKGENVVCIISGRKVSTVAILSSIYNLFFMIYFL